ncbi:hypothetical protein LCE31_39405, partial [Streptomyces sp. 8L]|nr:hypothetical protein [Streptomyces sp. 8L]
MCEVRAEDVAVGGDRRQLGPVAYEVLRVLQRVDGDHVPRQPRHGGDQHRGPAHEFRDADGFSHGHPAGAGGLRGAARRPAGPGGGRPA